MISELNLYNLDCDVELRDVAKKLNEVICAMNKGAQPTQADNTGSPKLPSIEECYKAIPFPEDDHEQAYFVAGIAECHKFIARQLSGRA